MMPAATAMRERLQTESRLPVSLRSELCGWKTDAAAIAASVQSFRDAIRGGATEFRDGAWYPPAKK